jgi:hypothetical protein
MRGKNFKKGITLIVALACVLVSIPILSADDDPSVYPGATLEFDDSEAFDIDFVYPGTATLILDVTTTGPAVLADDFNVRFVLLEGDNEAVDVIATNRRNDEKFYLIDPNDG